jgi:hypothetical protein
VELTQRQRNRAVLARQLLLERSRLPLVRAVERIGGIQAQYAPSAYVGLWSRLEGFRHDQLTRALEQKRLVQATLMRGTIHIVSRADYWPMYEGTREARHVWFLRVNKIQDARAVDRAAARLRALLQDGPRRRDELIRELTKAEWARVGAEPALVRVPPSGTWERRRADLFGLAEEWLGAATVDGEAGRDLLLRRYLGAFGPARVIDAADWMSVPVTMLRPTVERAKLRHFVAADSGEELVDFPRAPLPPPETPAPPRFLGTWDALLLAHARGTGILPEEYRPRIFHTKAPQSFFTFTLDGAVAGTWRVERSKTSAELRLEPFAPVPRTAKRELLDEAEGVVRFMEPDAPAFRVR